MFRVQRLRELTKSRDEGTIPAHVNLDRQVLSEWLGKTSDQVYGYDMEAYRLRMLAMDEVKGSIGATTEGVDVCLFFSMLPTPLLHVRLTLLNLRTIYLTQDLIFSLQAVDISHFTEIRPSHSQCPALSSESVFSFDEASRMGLMSLLRKVLPD